MFYFLVVRIQQVEFHAAELGAFATVGRAAKASLGSIAYAGIAYA